MSVPTREEIDAKLATIAATLSGDAKEHQAKIDYRLASLDDTFKAGFKSIQDEIGTKFAQLDASNQKAQSDTIKWVVGVVLGGVTVSISVMSFLLTNSVQKSAPSMTMPPITIYAQPAPTTGAPPVIAPPTSNRQN